MLNSSIVTVENSRTGSDISVLPVTQTPHLKRPAYKPFHPILSHASLPQKSLTCHMLCVQTVGQPQTCPLVLRGTGQGPQHTGTGGQAQHTLLSHLTQCVSIMASMLTSRQCVCVSGGGTFEHILVYSYPSCTHAHCHNTRSEGTGTWDVIHHQVALQTSR